MIRTVIVLAGLLLIVVLVVTIVIINTKPKSLGQKCKIDLDCHKGLACNNSLCKKLQDYPCLSDSDCVTGSCVQNICHNPLARRTRQDALPHVTSELHDNIPRVPHEETSMSQPWERALEFMGKRLTFKILSDLNAPGIYLNYKGDWYRVVKGIWTDVVTDGTSILGVAGNNKRVIMRA